MSYKEKEFIYEVYKSNYDDKGKIICTDRSRAGASQMAEALSSRSSVFQGRGTKQLAAGAGGSSRADSQGLVKNAGYSADLIANATASVKQLSYMEINNKFVCINNLDEARSEKNGKKIQDLIDLEENEALLAEHVKNKGLIQVDREFLVTVAMTNLKNWTDIWRNVRQQYDFDKNGFVSVDELTELFYQYFPAQLEGKTMARYFKEFISFYDNTLINYKSVREEINAEITKRLAEIKANPAAS